MTQSLHLTRPEGDAIYENRRDYEAWRIAENESHADDGPIEDELEHARACVDLEMRLYGEVLR